MCKINKTLIDQDDVLMLTLNNENMLISTIGIIKYVALVILTHINPPKLQKQT